MDRSSTSTAACSPCCNPSPVSTSSNRGSPMRTVVVHAPLDLRIETLAPAPAPGAGQVKVSLAAGGICGSDLHYYQHGGFGTIRLKEPMILGHEVAGTAVAVGADVTRAETGAPV